MGRGLPGGRVGQGRAARGLPGGREAMGLPGGRRRGRRRLKKGMENGRIGAVYVNTAVSLY